MQWRAWAVIGVLLVVGGMLGAAYLTSGCPLSDSGLCVGPCPAFIDRNGDGVCDREQAAALTLPTPAVVKVGPSAGATAPATEGSEPAVACPFGRVNDPYPGQCGRYVDSNHNGICDLSEPGFGTETPLPTDAPTSAATSSPPTPTPTAGTEPAVACPFGRVNDPYPGQCGRYVDSNHNGICDLSEPGSDDTSADGNGGFSLPILPTTPRRYRFGRRGQ